jgi:hypothetical protein
VTTPFTSFEDLDVEVTRLVDYGKRTFPNRVDYEKAAEALGLDPGSAWSEPSFAAAVLRDWHATGQTGCLFARLLARGASHEQWQSLVLSGSSRDELHDSISESAAKGIDAALAAPECEILSLVFPGVQDAAALRATCELLVEHSEISMTEDRSHAGLVMVAMRLDVSGDGKLAWIMAFGPFDTWPATRRAPVLELAIRVKPKPARLFHKLNQDPTAAHLADSDPRLTEEKMGKVFERTERATRDVLGSDPDHRSAAKTTFSLPAAEWDAAG